MMLNEFEVRSYGWQELAVLYGPDLMPASAGKRLSKWVGVNPELKAELQGNGWRKGRSEERRVGKECRSRGSPSH